MEENTREYIVRLAKSLTGTPYVWGGDKPFIGMDCSGFVIFVFRICGLLPDEGDWTADNLSRLWERSTSPQKGYLAFYGKSDESISHVAICTGGTFAISARGAGKGATRESSLKIGAGVKPHSIYYRNDFRFIADISKPMIG